MTPEQEKIQKDILDSDLSDFGKMMALDKARISVPPCPCGHPGDPGAPTGPMKEKSNKKDWESPYANR